MTVYFAFPTLVNYFSIEAFEILAPNLSKETVTTTEGGEVQIRSSQRNLELLLDPSVRVYVAFMEYALNYHNYFKALYQPKGLLIHKVYTSIEKILEQVGQDFLDPESLSQITSDNSIVKDHVKPLKDVFLGAFATDLLDEMAAEVVLEIKQTCLNYNITCVEEMRKRYLENRDLLSSLSFVEPKIALSLEERENYPYLKDITKFFPYIDADKLAFEWRPLPLQFDRDTVTKYIKLDVESFW